jgi:hypothetical protein
MESLTLRTQLTKEIKNEEELEALMDRLYNIGN